jgi:hypothetical protein
MADNELHRAIAEIADPIKQNKPRGKNIHHILHQTINLYSLLFLFTVQMNIFG